MVIKGLPRWCDRFNVYGKVRFIKMSLIGALGP
jgi:hypothetical protein